MNAKQINKAAAALLNQSTRVGGTTVQHSAIFAMIVRTHKEELRKMFVQGYQAGLAAHQKALDSAPAIPTAEEALEIYSPQLVDK